MTPGERLFGEVMREVRAGFGLLEALALKNSARDAQNYNDADFAKLPKSLRERIEALAIRCMMSGTK